jgi:hypothetical protein
MLSNVLPASSLVGVANAAGSVRTSVPADEQPIIAAKRKAATKATSAGLLRVIIWLWNGSIEQEESGV